MSTQNAIADTPIYMFERGAETMPRSELRALQLSRLKTTVERAYNKVLNDRVPRIDRDARPYVP